MTHSRQSLGISYLTQRSFLWLDRYCLPTPGGLSCCWDDEISSDCLTYCRGTNKSRILKPLLVTFHCCVWLTSTLSFWDTQFQGFLFLCVFISQMNCPLTSFQLILEKYLTTQAPSFFFSGTRIQNMVYLQTENYCGTEFKVHVCECIFKKKKHKKN